MRYEPVGPISAAEAVERFSSNNPRVVSEALISTALHLPDSSWVETWIIRLSTHEEPDVRRATALSLGHLARLHKHVGTAALEAVKALADDPAITGTVQDALEDVEIFTRPE
jgi:hypothetical protein